MGRRTVKDFKACSTGGGSSPDGSIDTTVAGAGSLVGRVFLRSGTNSLNLFIFYNSAEDAEAWRVTMDGTNKLFIWTVDTTSSGTVLPLMDYACPIGEWFDLITTIEQDETTLRGKIYINGTLVKEASATRDMRECARFSISSAARLSTFDVAAYERILTDEEILAYTDYREIPDSPTLYYPGDEGAGDIMYDESGNGNDIASTSGLSWSKEVPTAKRKTVGGNLVRNGDFSYIPVVNELQISSGWINGLAGGGGASVIPQPFARYGNLNSGASLQFLEGEGYQGSNALYMKTVGGGFAEARYNSTGYSGTLGQSDVIVAEPNTSYTLSFWMKTLHTSGDATNGALVSVSQSNGNKNGVTSALSTPIKTTTEWTKYTLEFTTHADTRFLSPNIYNYSHQGAGTLALEAWFSDIDLRKTSDVARL